MAEKLLMKGNEAIAEAAIMSGCQYFFGYPITPQTELAAYMAKRLPKIGGTFLQAESEIAAINMVIGASSAGARCMTSSSSPGVALKGEGLSYLAGCDLPAFLVNIQRAGPGLGGIQPSQADYFHATKGAGHGDFHMFVLAPNSVQEMVDLTMDGFDIADKYRMTVMMLGDGMLGQMMEPVSLDRPKHETLPAKTWAVSGTQNNRTPNIVNSLYIQPEELERIVEERYKRYDHIKATEARSEEFLTEDAEIVVVAYGGCARIAKNAINAARAKGIKVGLVRPITLWPFPKAALQKTLKTAKSYIVVEMSMGQMIEDVELATECKRPVQFCGRTGGMVPTPQEILAKIELAAGGTK